MAKKVFKVLGIIGLALLCLFCLMLSFFKPLPLVVNASDSSIYYYYNCNVISIMDDEDNDSTINVNYAPSSFYGNGTQFDSFGSKEIDLFYLDLYQGNNAFRIKFKLQTAYQDSVGLYAYNDSHDYFMCYYVRSGSSVPYTYSPRMNLLNNVGGIITIPSNYTYSFTNVSNEFNLTYNSVLRLNYWNAIDVSQFHNYILNGDYSEVDNRLVFETGYSQGYSQGQTDIINSPNEYDLYTQNQYEANYNTGFSAGADSDLTTNGFRVMMSTIFNAPYQILKPILNFELLGVNLWKLFTFVISITLVIIVVGAVKKR